MLLDKIQQFVHILSNKKLQMSEKNQKKGLDVNAKMFLTAMIIIFALMCNIGTGISRIDAIILM